MVLNLPEQMGAIIYVNRSNNKRIIVPMHSKDLKKGTLHRILKQAGIDLKD